MDKQVIGWSYWLGMVCVALTLVTRALAFLGIFSTGVVIGPGGHPITFRTFLGGALLLFLVAIATWCYASFKSLKPQA